MTKFITKLVVILFVTSIQAQQTPVSKSITRTLGKEYKFTSSVLKEERTLLIHVPNSYSTSSKKYPVIYVLDGNNHFNHAINAASLLSDNGRMPESIIVAIPNNRGTRGRDLGRGKDNFKKYIKEEVIPFVNKKYRTASHKTLFGHSMAGAFTLNYLATEPTMFDAYISASPVVQINNSELLEQFPILFKKNKTLSKPLYFTLADVEAEGQRATDALNKFVALLEKEAPKSFPWKYDFIENQIHMTTPYLTMYKGFTEVFHDFQSPSFTSYLDFKGKGGMNYLKSYYAKRAATYHTENVISENTLRRLSTVLLRENKEKMAIELLRQNVKNHPKSMGALNSLARTYVRLKQIEKAKNIYFTAAKLAEQQGSPNSDYFKRQIKRLEEN